MPFPPVRSTQQIAKLVAFEPMVFRQCESVCDGKHRVVFSRDTAAAFARQASTEHDCSKLDQIVGRGYRDDQMPVTREHSRAVRRMTAAMK